MTGSLMARAGRFAHLSGIGLRGARAEDDDDTRDDKASKRSRADDGDGDDEKDDKSSKRSRADDQDKDYEDDDKSSRRSKTSKRSRADDGDGDDDEDDKSARRARAADDDDDYCEDEEDEKKDSRKSRRARAEDDDDDDDDKDEMNGRSAAANARRRERARCAAIFEHPAASGNPELAASLAFETTLTRREAVAVLKRQASRDGGRAHDVRDARRSRNPDLGPGGSAAAPSGGQAVSALWDKAIEKAARKPR